MSSASFLIYRKRKGTFSKEGLNERSLSHKMTPFDVGNNFVTKTKKKKKRERRLSVSDCFKHLGWGKSLTIRLAFNGKRYEQQ